MSVNESLHSRNNAFYISSEITSKKTEISNLEKIFDDFNKKRSDLYASLDDDSYIASRRISNWELEMGGQLITLINLVLEAAWNLRKMGYMEEWDKVKKMAQTVTTQYLHNSQRSCVDKIENYEKNSKI